MPIMSCIQDIIMNKLSCSMRIEIEIVYAY